MRWFLLLGLVLTLSAGPAVAVITSDTFQITDANGTVLMDVNGMPAAGSLSETDEPAGSFGTLTFGLTGTISAPVSAGLQEPGSVGLLGLSDSVFITQQPQSHLSVSFSSDGEGSGQICDPAVGGPNICMTETGQLQDLTPLLFSEESPPFHVKIQSDTEVPEPSTIVLLAAGLGGMSVVRQRRLSARGAI